ncbi:MAG: sensor domain-containing diguanylate cyclase [Bacillota bacterium]|nr:sensor domain-containing diguanylate cyclase [Bacillota bacterium]
MRIKDCFLDLVDMELGLLSFETFVKETLLIFQETFHVETVVFYTYQEWKQQFDLAGYVSKKGMRDSLPTYIRLNDYENSMGDHTILRKATQTPLNGQLDLFIEIKYKSERLGFVAIKDVNLPQMDQIDINLLSDLATEYGVLLSKAQNLAGIINEKGKYKQLFRVTEKFHSSMNMDALLGEIILTLQEVYPAFSYFLLLSHDNHNHIDLPIKDLEYDSENIAAMQAYVTGTIQFEDSLIGHRSILYAPLKGKQGVYGVLQVIAPNTLLFSESEIEFITLLAITAGSALENAQLYEQSKKIISDLQLINETSHCLNSNLRLSEIINYMSGQIKRSFEAEEVGFFIHTSEQEMTKVLPGSTDFFQTKQSRPYIEYIKNKIDKENDSLFIGDLNIPLIENVSKYRSIVAIPMEQSESLKGFAIVMHRQPYYFSFETFKLLQSLIHHSTLAFTNSMLREELEKMIITDHLTKLHSRNYLDEVIQRSMREDTQGTFILIDIDNFKVINDTYGHQVGDEVLIQVANLIRGNIREKDVGARWGGEELAIYLPKVSLSTGTSIAERLVEKVSELSKPHVTISCGISYWNKELLDTYKYLFKRADEALYLAKDTGKNKVVTQEDNMRVS